MEEILVLVILLFAVLQIVMIIKFFNMCGNIKFMRDSFDQLAETFPDALTGFRRSLLLGDKETAKKELVKAYSIKLIGLAENIMNNDSIDLNGVKAEYEKLLQTVEASLPDTLKEIHTIGDLRSFLKMRNWVEDSSGSIYRMLG